MSVLRSPLSLALMGALAVATIAGFLLIPADAILPIRWGFDFAPTETAERNFALLQMPFGAVLVWGVVWAFLRFGNQERAARNQASMRVILPAVTALFLAVQIAIVTAGLR